MIGSPADPTTMEVLMGLSRKRQREFDQLKRQAETLIQDQKDVLDHAAKVARQAGHQAANFAREEVGPGVRDIYDERVRPAVKAGRTAARHGRDRFVDDVIPALTSALGSALAVIETAKNPQVRDVVSKVSKKAADAGLIQKKSSGPAKYIVIGVAAVAVAGIAFAAWQTLRADDSLWIEDEPEEELSAS
jgi:hypothetical protein